MDMFFFRFWLFLKEIQQRNTYDSYKCIEYQLGWVYSKISKKKPYLYLTGIDMFFSSISFKNSQKQQKGRGEHLRRRRRKNCVFLYFVFFIAGLKMPGMPALSRFPASMKDENAEMKEFLDALPYLEFKSVLQYHLK